MPSYRSSMRIGFAVAVALLAITAVLRSVSAERARRLAALAGDALEAAADTTRAVRAGDKLLGDSLQAVERRAVQAELRASKLDRALHTQRMASHRLQASVAELSRTVRSETVFVADSEGARRAEFRIRDAPYTVTAAVTLPRPPAPGAMDVRVALDTLGLEVSVACGAARADGVRPAVARVIGPAWASVSLTKVEQEASVCAGAGHRYGPGLASWLLRAAQRLSVNAGFGATRVASGSVVSGASVTAGVRIWP